jgi:hypothetical protein
MSLDPETSRRKVLARKRLNEKWLWLRDFVGSIHKMSMIGPTNPVEAQILRECLTLILAEMNFRAQESAELMMGMDPNQQTDEPDGPSSAGEPGSSV